MVGVWFIVLLSSDVKLECVWGLGVFELDMINYCVMFEWYEVVFVCMDGCGVDYVIEVGGGGML